MMQKLLLPLLFGYYKVLTKTRGAASALRAAKQLDCIAVGLLLLNCLFWVLPASLLDSVIPYALTAVASAVSVYSATADMAEVEAAMNRLNYHSRFKKAVICVSSFLAVPGLYTLLMHQIFRS